MLNMQLFVVEGRLNETKCLPCGATRLVEEGFPLVEKYRRFYLCFI